MDIRGVIKEKDVILSQYLHMKPRLAFSIIGSILIVFLLITLIYAFTIQLFLSILFLSGYFALFIPYRAKKLYKEYSAMQDPITVALVDIGIEFKTSRGSGVLHWSDIKKIKRSKSLLLIYPNSALFHIVPAHFFANNEEFNSFANSIESKCAAIT